MAIAGQLDAMGETRGQIADEMPSRNSIAAMGRRATAVLGRGGGWDDENLGRVVGGAGSMQGSVCDYSPGRA
jgi:hypothetical protein